MQFQTIWEARRWASLFLKQHNREALVADMLLEHYLGMTKAQLLASLQEPFPQEVVDKFQEAIYAHAEKGVPVQHLIGYEYFYGRSFQVNEHVLIPRPETEELVALVLKEIDVGFSDSEETLKVVDIGAGSGAISVTLKKENPSLHVMAVDISEEALQVAKTNAENLEADVEFLQGDFLQPLMDRNIKVDIVVSNPPYIPTVDKDTLSDTVKDYDPELALFAGEDGLDAYRAIIKDLPKVLNPKGLLAFEIGYQQGEAVKQLLLTAYPHSHPQIVQDINKKDRIVYCWLP